MNLEANKKAREEAEAAFLLACDAAHALPEELEKRFWEVLYFHVGKAVGAVEPENPKALQMSDTQARAFEKKLMPWGKYRGDPVGDVELDYLFFLAEKPDEFMADLRRYLRSDRVLQDQGGR